MRLEQVCFAKDSWTLLDVILVLTLPDEIHLKALAEDGTMAGFAAASIKRNENAGWITTLGVFPSYRNQGIGSALLEACESSFGLPFARLTVNINNQPAIELYQKKGYQQIDLWRRYYRNQEDAIVMEKRL
jgi:ribosomal-protein-alanine N-acetyltransferase